PATSLTLVWHETPDGGEKIKGIESVFTVVGGKIVHATEEFATQRRRFCFRFDGPSSRCRNSGAVFLVCRPAQLSSKRRRQPQLSGLQCAYTSAHEARQGLAPFMQKRSGEYEKIFEIRRA